MMEGPRTPQTKRPPSAKVEQSVERKNVRTTEFLGEEANRERYRLVIGNIKNLNATPRGPNPYGINTNINIRYKEEAGRTDAMEENWLRMNALLNDDNSIDLTDPNGVWKVVIMPSGEMLGDPPPKLLELLSFEKHEWDEETIDNGVKRTEHKMNIRSKAAFKLGYGYQPFDLQLQ